MRSASDRKTALTNWMKFRIGGCKGHSAVVLLWRNPLCCCSSMEERCGSSMEEPVVLFFDGGTGCCDDLVGGRLVLLF